MNNKIEKFTPEYMTELTNEIFNKIKKEFEANYPEFKFTTNAEACNAFQDTKYYIQIECLKHTGTLTIRVRQRQKRNGLLGYRLTDKLEITIGAVWGRGETLKEKNYTKKNNGEFSWEKIIADIDNKLQKLKEIKSLEEHRQKKKIKNAEFITTNNITQQWNGGNCSTSDIDIDEGFGAATIELQHVPQEKLLQAIRAIYEITKENV